MQKNRLLEIVKSVGRMKNVYFAGLVEIFFFISNCLLYECLRVVIGNVGFLEFYLSFDIVSQFDVDNLERISQKHFNELTVKLIRQIS